MAVDVQTKIEIRRPRPVVAAYAADPGHATAWYRNIVEVTWKTEPPLAVGSQVAFVARFLGRQLAYTYEITDYTAGERLVMSTADGPFAMETTYTWTDGENGATEMTLRNAGEPAGVARVSAPLLEAAMRRANRADLRRLKEILESTARDAPSQRPRSS
jgi:Polyketide cyclase / dehydrase and lipid transport